MITCISISPCVPTHPSTHLELQTSRVLLPCIRVVHPIHTKQMTRKTHDTQGKDKHDKAIYTRIRLWEEASNFRNTLFIKETWILYSLYAHTYVYIHASSSFFNSWRCRFVFVRGFPHLRGVIHKKFHYKSHPLPQQVMPIEITAQVCSACRLAHGSEDLQHTRQWLPTNSSSTNKYLYRTPYTRVSRTPDEHMNRERVEVPTLAHREALHLT